MQQENPYGTNDETLNPPFDSSEPATEYVASFSSRFGAIATVFGCIFFQGGIGFFAFLYFSYLMIGFYKEEKVDFASCFVFQICAIINLLCGLLGCVAVRKTCKKISVYENRIRLFMYYGKPIDIFWKDVDAVQERKGKKWFLDSKTHTRAVKLEYRDPDSGKKRKRYLIYNQFKNSDGMYETLLRLHSRETY